MSRYYKKTVLIYAKEGAPMPAPTRVHQEAVVTLLYVASLVSLLLPGVQKAKK